MKRERKKETFRRQRHHQSRPSAFFLALTIGSINIFSKIFSMKFLLVLHKAFTKLLKKSGMEDCREKRRAETNGISESGTVQSFQVAMTGEKIAKRILESFRAHG